MNMTFDTENILPQNLMLGVVYKPPFRSLGHALAWFNDHNPARQRYVNLLEPERLKKPPTQDFSGDSEADKWASLAAAINSVLKEQTYEVRRVWALANLGDRQQQEHPNDIAKKLGLKIQLVRKYLSDVADKLTYELQQRELMPVMDDHQRMTEFNLQLDKIICLINVINDNVKTADDLERVVELCSTLKERARYLMKLSQNNLKVN